MVHAKLPARIVKIRIVHLKIKFRDGPQCNFSRLWQITAPYHRNRGCGMMRHARKDRFRHYLWSNPFRLNE